MKVVSERLGHSSPAFTMTVDQHVIPGMQADAARLVCDARVRRARYLKSTASISSILAQA